ncbi:MAG: ribosome recycling factor [Candidatus Moraniibacteriota bacterium]|nr:MAG: ribosome recycling factor [Candidatus Moranbacteria bacterium]
MYQSIIEERKLFFEEAIQHFAEEAAKIRTGRATPALVDHILVESYGAKTPLRQMASVSAPEARLVVIQPWDRRELQNIETAIRAADLGLTPTNDGQLIRLTLPPLTEERRRDLVKGLNRLAEESRISIRTLREEAWKEIQELEKSGAMGEDDKFRGRDALQETVESFNERIELLRKKKESEILTL